MKIELNQQPKTPAGFSKMSVRDKLIEISLLITSLSIMFKEVREQIEKDERIFNP